MYIDASGTLTTTAVALAGVLTVAITLVMTGLVSQIGLGYGIRKFTRYVTGRKF